MPCFLYQNAHCCHWRVLVVWSDSLWNFVIMLLLIMERCLRHWLQLFLKLQLISYNLRNNTDFKTRLCLLVHSCKFKGKIYTTSGWLLLMVYTRSLHFSLTDRILDIFLIFFTSQKKQSAFTIAHLLFSVWLFVQNVKKFTSMHLASLKCNLLVHLLVFCDDFNPKKSSGTRHPPKKCTLNFLKEGHYFLFWNIHYEPVLKRQDLCLQF